MVQHSRPYMIIGKTIALTIRTFVGKVISLLFNTMSRFVIVFLPRSKYLLISWLESPSAVILEPKKIKSVTASISLDCFHGLQLNPGTAWFCPGSRLRGQYWFPSSSHHAFLTCCPSHRFPLVSLPAFLASRPPLLTYPLSRSLIFSSLPPHSLPSAVGARSWETEEQISAPLWSLTPVPFLSSFLSIFRVSASSYAFPSTTSPPVLRKELGTCVLLVASWHDVLENACTLEFNNLDWNPGLFLTCSFEYIR